MSGAELDTIIAPATPVGRSALAIVRMDGPRARELAEEWAGRKLEERRATRVRLSDRDGVIDEAIVTLYVAPRSFSGNDLVEVSLHGSPAVVDRLLRAATDAGARLAEAGEFTERAVLNGKLDLVQAEAIGDLIASRTAAQSKLALANLEGALSREARAAREELVAILSRVEAALDFAEEGYTFIERSEAIARLGRLAEDLRGIEETFRRGRATAGGVTLVILGRPNAGKSTLLNALCGEDRAIVTPIPGTTRDLVRETIELGGLPVMVVDTAGLRKTSDEVEGIGVARAREAASRAEMVVYLIDASVGEVAEDGEALERHPEAIVVHTKIDLAGAPEGALGISVATGEGLRELVERLAGEVREKYAVPEGGGAVVNERQRRALAEAREGVEAALKG
ncbi:MAG: tRNA uridine-5-carboxymethylaminomethyl(34) synthesis GTPase MnmE, partial [Thermoanaerobaculia bacterium]